MTTHESVLILAVAPNITNVFHTVPAESIACKPPQSLHMLTHMQVHFSSTTSKLN